MMLIPDYHLQLTFGYQNLLRSKSSGFKNFQKYRVVLGFLERARTGFRLENHDPVPTLVTSNLSFKHALTKGRKNSQKS